MGNHPGFTGRGRAGKSAGKDRQTPSPTGATRTIIVIFVIILLLVKAVSYVIKHAGAFAFGPV